MEISTSQWIDVDAEFSVQEVYDAMDESEIEEMIELLTEGGHLKSDRDRVFGESTYSDEEWELMLTDLMRRNARLLVTEEEYQQIKSIHQRIN